MSNCKSVQVIVQGVVPSFNIENSSSIKLVLSKATMAVNDGAGPTVLTSRIDSTNIEFPLPEGEYPDQTYNVPEQFETKFDGKTFVTEKVTHG